MNAKNVGAGGGDLAASQMNEHRLVSWEVALVEEASRIWARVCRMVLDGRSAEGHACRDHLRQTVEKVLAGVCQSERSPGTMPDFETIWQARFAQWQSEEDLEDLVAMAAAPTREVRASWPANGFPERWRVDEQDMPV